MTCEEDLVEQAESMAKVNPSTHTFVYRNLVKVREGGREELRLAPCSADRRRTT